MTENAIQDDSNLDLVLSRIIDVPRKMVWKAWTDPALIVQWFTPAPWTTKSCEIDLVAGGIFRTVMKSPGGQEFINIGCFLEIVEYEKLVFTDALTPGFRPTGKPFFTAVIELQDAEDNTKYTATAMHKDEADREKHEEMGFYEGWGKCIEQLVDVVKGSKF